MTRIFRSGNDLRTYLYHFRFVGLQVHDSFPSGLFDHRLYNGLSLLNHTVVLNPALYDQDLLFSLTTTLISG